MTREDLAEVIRIERACFHDPWEGAAFDRECDNPISRAMVARNDSGRMVGYVIYWVVGPEFHVLNVAVHPDFRRQGMGRLMMDHVMADARKDRVDFVALEVRRGNIAARTLYRSMGFATVGFRKGYYRDGEDAEVMIARLDSNLPQ
jgi:ribosomal-protein-alanine N-acetyltransferase